MVDTRDLKSLGQQCPCEFESHPRHYIYGAYPRTPALAAQARFLNPSHFVTAPFRGMPAWQASAGRLRCFDVCDISLALRRAACAAPSGSLFPTLQSKVPRPRRSADADSLVKPFSDVFLLGISPDPCACCASALSQPQSLLIRGISPNPCGAQVAFRLCRAKSREDEGEVYIEGKIISNLLMN